MSAGVEILLLGGGGDLVGAGFETEVFGFPPPEEIRVVSGPKSGPELLDQPDDEVRTGEQLHVYRRESHGTYKQGRRCGFFGTYTLLRASLAPLPQPSLFEAELRAL